MTKLIKAENPMPQLYKRLSDVGFNKKFVRETVLPHWWQDEIAETPSGYEHAVGLISRNLGLDPPTLRGTESEITYNAAGSRRFKKRLRDSEKDLMLAECVATRVADLAAFATTSTYIAPNPNAQELRAALLKRNPQYVDLDTLLDYCWVSGIPVLHVSTFPRNAKKMQGLGIRLEDRPVIILADNHRSSAWLLFVLAHELGHIARGHLRLDEPKVDKDIRKGDGSQEENEANAFAVELLLGEPDARYMSRVRISGDTLAASARSIGVERHVYPGAIVLNYARTTGYWPVAITALQLLEANGDGTETIRAHAVASLVWERMPEESQEYLKRVTRSESPR